ncbi:MAG: hybrid sensor histidine kinase/response regulator [Chloroflexi bacterium]|nr:hybrid sensor histidine kinase/response regulator [Chloroflexota bacterium]
MNTSKKPHTILVIDDDRPMLLGLKTLLERSGYDVIACENSVDGIKQSGESQPDLIVCDIMMPSLDGYKVREAMSANPLTHNIPFLFLSARASQDDKIKGFEDGADDYITKPFDPRELVARINAVFRRQDKSHQSVTEEINRQIERIQSEITHNFSHELRTPMMQILMSLDMALRDKYDDPNELKYFVETALSKSHHLYTLIDDLTFLSNYDMGNKINFRQRIDIKNDFSLPIALRLEQYEDKKLQVNINIAEGIKIHAPRREFRQACSHLVDNSLKFSPPMMSILIDLAANGDGGCILTVTDYGQGIPTELHEKVFKRYYQVSQGITREYGGLGVGLTIARIIARSLDGDVTILPTEQGCAVQMVLPPAPPDMP